MKCEFRGERLVALRELEGITQAELAATLGVAPSAISQVAKGDRNFPESWAAALAETYRVPVEFFAVAPTLADHGVLTFRKKSTARVREEKRVHRLYAEAARLFRYGSRESGYIAATLPDPTDFDNDPEAVAEEIRRLDPKSDATGPIRNVTRLCERLGVGVVDQLDPRVQDDVRHSGVSRPSPHEDRPTIAVAADLSPAVKRFTIAHELYHLIADRGLERPLRSTRDPRELAANRFAGALLLPRSVAEHHLSSTMTLHGYLKVKAEYGVEVRGLIHRAKDLRLITPDRERSLYIQWSTNGWRTHEPVSVPNERPLLLGQTLWQVEGKNYAARLSHTIGVPAPLITHWTDPGNDLETADARNVIALEERRRRTS